MPDGAILPDMAEFPDSGKGTNGNPGAIFWRMVGDTGNVVATFRPNGGQPFVQTIGTWVITPVPLPAAAWLLLGGLGALGVLSRKRRAA